MIEIKGSTAKELLSTGTVRVVVVLGCQTLTTRPKLNSESMIVVKMPTEG